MEEMISLRKILPKKPLHNHFVCITIKENDI